MQATDFVDSYFEAWNHHDAALVAGHLTADGTYCDIPEQQQHTRNELVASLEGFFAANHHRYERIGEILVGRKTIAFQYRVAAPESPANGWLGAEFVTLGGDGALRILDYYDMPGPLPAALPARGEATHSRKYARSGLNARDMQRHRQRLEKLMRIERAYLQPDLTLPELARRVGCSVNHLSQVINQGCGVCFFDYLNRHRVQHAQQLLVATRTDGRSILEVALASGFSSHSSFYAAFRRITGLTPAAYRDVQGSRDSAKL